MDELIDVRSRPRIVQKYRLDPEDVAEYVALIVEKSEVVRAQGSLRLCRDPRDDVVLETALIGRATSLVSRDDDIKRDEELLQEMARRGVSVVSVASFLSLLSEQI